VYMIGEKASDAILTDVTAGVGLVRRRSEQCAKGLSTGLGGDRPDP
jgi:hypothetical protein